MHAAFDNTIERFRRERFLRANALNDRKGLERGQGDREPRETTVADGISKTAIENIIKQ